MNEGMTRDSQQEYWVNGRKLGTGALMRAGVLLLGLVLALAMNHHWLLPDLRFVPGDRGDTRLVVFTLEHWANAFKGREAFFVLNMFYPSTLALGYADGLFLLAPPYALFRAMGLDYFTSYQVVFVGMTAVGYIAWMWLLQKALRLDLGFATLGAVLLTSLNALQFQAQIGKLSAFNLWPILIGLLYLYLTAGKEKRWKAWGSLAGFSTLLGLLFFTSYYPAWFFLFTLLVVAIVALVGAAFRLGVRLTAQSAGKFLVGHKWELAVGALVLAASLVPFAVTYAPLITANAKRSFDLVLEFAPRPWDVINVSAANYAWSPVLRLAQFRFGDREVQMGSPVLVLCLFVYFYGRQILSMYGRASGGQDAHDRFVFLLSTTAALILILIVQVRGISLWYPIYRLVPGASALRALGRYLIVVDMIVVVGAVFGLNKLYRSWRTQGKLPSSLLLGALVVISAAMVIEQLNGSAYRLDKAQELAFLDRFRPPASDCKAFFISNPQSTDLPIGYYQLDAMMISMKLDIPTVNGYSGIAPDAAFTMVPNGPEYKYRILQWLSENGAEAGICELEMRTAAFRSVGVSAELPQYQRIYRASLVEAYSALYEAARRFATAGEELSNLYPQYLEEHGYLDPAFGHQSGVAYKWIQDRYWIGERPCNAGTCVGIGVVGALADLGGVLKQYTEQANKIYFPYPEVYAADNPPAANTQGQLLMIFSASELHQ